MIGMVIAPALKFLSPAGFFKRTPGFGVRQQNRALWVDDLGDLAHETHTTKHDDIRIGFSRLA